MPKYEIKLIVETDYKDPDQVLTALSYIEDKGIRINDSNIKRYFSQNEKIKYDMLYKNTILSRKTPFTYDDILLEILARFDHADDKVNTEFVIKAFNELCREGFIIRTGKVYTVNKYNYAVEQFD